MTTIKPNALRSATLHAAAVAVLLSLAGGCAAPAPGTGGDLDDPDVRQQLQGSAGGGEAHPGAALYAEHCATCHNNGVARAPAMNILQFLAPESMLASLERGVMQQQAAHLSAEERTSVVEFLVGKPDPTPPRLPHCTPNARWFDTDDTPFARGWGIDYPNTRHMGVNVAGMTANDLGSLKVKWVFDYPRSARARSHPSFAGGALFVGSQTGTVYALDRKTGCVRWTYDAGAEVRTGITIPDWKEEKLEQPVGFFGDILARTHAINLATGEMLWKTLVDEHHNATATGQPVYFEGRVYQPVSSLEVVPAADPAYACCTFRGSIATLDASSGRLISKTFTIDQPPRQVGVNNVGTPSYAPSGAPVWNSPTLDKKLRRLYFGTGENYSSPAESRSDAILAMSIDDGRIVWSTQTTANDAWNVACMDIIENKTNCPQENGPDVDFGAPPILVEADGRRILVAGQKSGEIFGIDPVDGRILWRQKVGRGGVQGGMHFGMAADGGLVYVPISDYSDAQHPASEARPGLYALDAFTGGLLWSHPAPDVCGELPDCDPGISAAISAIDGAALAGHMDGVLRAYAQADGALLWEFDTKQDFKTLAGRTARGGSFGGGTAPVALDGMLYFNSGYGLYFHMPGNVLVAMGRR